MIRSFKDKETKAIFAREYSRKLPTDIQRSALRKLIMIHRAIELKDLISPLSNHLEVLKGNRKGQCSIRINKQWRICFKWKDGEAFEVEIVDYH